LIREAVMNDFEEIHNLCENDLGYECEKEIVKNRLSKLNYNRECVFVALIDDKIVGFIHVEKYEVLYAPAFANILGLAVSKNHRGQGIGKNLLSAAEDWAKSKNIAFMRLNSGSTRKEAHIFYRSNGYSNEKEQIRFIKQL